MGPNSFRNLTYAAVLAVVGSLVYLIYQSSKKKQKLNPAIESTSGLSAYTDTLGSLSGASTAALPADARTSSVDGQLVAGGSAALSTSPKDYASAGKSSKNSTSEVKDVMADEPGSIVTGPSDIASSEKRKVNVKSGKATVTSKSPSKAKAKFNAGGKGDLMVVAGAFSSKDNAVALVDKLKKLGFEKAETVKLENSANTYAIAGYYEFKGGADAAVRTLKASKLEGLVKKRSGEIYKPSTPVPAPKAVKAPTKPVKPVPNPAPVTNKPI